MDHVALADALGFDWIGCAEHHYSSGSSASNVSAVASAITQRRQPPRALHLEAAAYHVLRLAKQETPPRQVHQQTVRPGFERRDRCHPSHRLTMAGQTMLTSEQP